MVLLCSQAHYSLLLKTTVNQSLKWKPLQYFLGFSDCITVSGETFQKDKRCELPCIFSRRVHFYIFLSRAQIGLCSRYVNAIWYPSVLTKHVMWSGLSTKNTIIVKQSRITRSTSKQRHNHDILHSITDSPFLLPCSKYLLFQITRQFLTRDVSSCHSADDDEIGPVARSWAQWLQRLPVRAHIHTYVYIRI